MISSLLALAVFSTLSTSPARVIISGSSSDRSSISLTVEPMRGVEGMISVPPGAQRVPMLTLRMTAACGGDVPVTAVTVEHRGLGSAADIDRVYAMSDGRRLSRGMQIADRSGVVQLRLQHFSVPACSTKEVGIFVDFSNSAAVAGQHRFTIRFANDVDALPAQVLLLSERVGTMRQTVGKSTGTITVAYLSVQKPVYYGADRTVARFTLTADQTEDHAITSITLTNEGSARNQDLRSLSLYASGKRVTKMAESLDDDRVRLVFDPAFSLQRGQQRVFTLHADVRASIRKTIQLLIEEPSDIEAEPAQGRVRQ
ncbi:MAG: hypothetical protein PHH13_04480 [Candidatus Peribacteraceae bacterium]|nr:hypothetical protein [Candidatus Peribacteraceae bacterium]